MVNIFLALALGPAAALLSSTRPRRSMSTRVAMDYKNPTATLGTKGQILTESPMGKKQDFLEATPYWDQSAVPLNTWRNKAPYTAKVVSCKRIVGPEATGETCGSRC